MKKTLFTIVMALFPLLAFADAVEVDGIYYTLISKTKTAEVTRSSSGYAGDVVIPSTINYDNADYSVTSIGEDAFGMNYNLTSVTIPNSVTNIKQYAFKRCLKLAYVTIGDGVTSIGNEAFANCDELTSIAIPNSVTSIENGAFYGCI